MKTIFSFYLFSFCLITSLNCNFQSEELIELPPKTPELAVFVELSNISGFSAYVLKKRIPNEPIEWDFNLGDSIFAIQTNQVVYIAKSSSFVSGKEQVFDIIQNAKVSIFEEGKFLTELKPEYKPMPHYVNYDYALKAGKKYQVEVAAPGYPSVTGEQLALSEIPAQSIEYKKNKFQSNGNGLLSELNVSFKDPINEINSYLISVILNKTNRKTNKREISKVPIYKTDPTSSTSNIINDRVFDGQNYNWRLGIDIERFLADTVDKDTRLDVTFFPINNDLEKFYRTLEAKENNYSNPFTEPVTPYYNVKGGLGIFSTSGKYTSKSFIIK